MDEYEAGFTLPFARKVIFGLGGFSVGLIRSILAMFQFAFLIEVVGLDIKWAGFILFVEQIIDSIGDLLIGFLSDNVYTKRFGKRKPWIYIMSLPTVLFWILCWIAPGLFEGKVEIQVTYYLSTYIAFSICMSSVFIPYVSIIPDIAQKQKERTSIVVLWQFFVIIGAAIASFFWATTIQLFPKNETSSYEISVESYRKGSIAAASIIGFFFLVTTFVGASSVQDRRTNPIKTPIKEMLKKTLKVINFQPFALLWMLQIFSMFSLVLFMENIYLYIQYVLEYNYSNYLILTTMVGKNTLKTL